MAFIKNIEHETVLSLADQVTVQPGQIVSRTLAQNKAVSITLFAFDKGEEISTGVRGKRQVYSRWKRAFLLRW